MRIVGIGAKVPKLNLRSCEAVAPESGGTIKGKV
jgi:hypothetical protein